MAGEWLVVHVRSPVLSAIRKEHACQGKVYAVWEAERMECCWVSQSIPAICEAANRALPTPRRQYAASFYNVLRFESMCGHHKHFRARMWDRRDVAGLSDFLRPFADVAFIIKQLHAWRLRSNVTDALLDREEAGAAQEY